MKENYTPDYKYASLVLDGISIKELVEYCPDLKRTFGYVDYGSGFAPDSEETPAKEALVAMLVGVGGKYF